MSWPIIVEKGSPKHRLWQVVGYALVAAIIFWIAYRMENYQILNFANVAAYSVAILGLMIIIGYSGQISIGQSFFFGLGAYVTAYLGVDHGWNFLLTLPVSAALGFAIGFVVGIPALRIRGPLPGARDARARCGVPGPGQAPGAREHHRRRQRQARGRDRLEATGLDARLADEPGLAIPRAAPRSGPSCSCSRRT